MYFRHFRGKSNCNFHIFYECMLGASDSERVEWGLTKHLTNKYLTDLNLDTSDYISKWSTLKQSFAELNIASQFGDVIKLVAAISHLNCCSFMQKSPQFDPESEKHLEQAAQLLGFSLSDLENCLLIHELKINFGRKHDLSPKISTSYVGSMNGSTNETRRSLLLLLNGQMCQTASSMSSSATKLTILKKPCNLNEIQQRNNCLVKLIYTEVFKWLVNKINKRLNASKCDQQDKLGNLKMFNLSFCLFRP